MTKHFKCLNFYPRPFIENYWYIILFELPDIDYVTFPQTSIPSAVDAIQLHTLGE